MESNVKNMVEIIFGLGLFFNAFVFIPQAIKIFRKKNAEEVSLFTFAGFNFMQVFTIWHAYYVKDYVLMSGFLLSLLTCGIVTILIICYRKK